MNESNIGELCEERVASIEEAYASILDLSDTAMVPNQLFTVYVDHFKVELPKGYSHLRLVEKKSHQEAGQQLLDNAWAVFQQSVAHFLADFGAGIDSKVKPGIDQLMQERIDGDALSYTITANLVLAKVYDAMGLGR